jgi:bacteriorhodopsin
MNVQYSFMVSYILLLTTGTICFIEAMRTKVPMIRHIFNLETCVSVVAAYFYYLFIEKIKEYEAAKKPINWKEMTEIRYLDWAITTPMMLIVLCAALGYNIKKTVHLSTISLIIILNYVMLYFGYLGETTMDKVTGAGISFAAFFAMYFIIFNHYIKPKYNLPNYVFYGLYLVVWTFYGVVYFLEEETKNYLFNALDVFSKTLIGIGLWCYYTKIIT